MAESLELEIATPERLLVREKVREIEIPGKEGYLGVLPGHAALLSELGMGVLVYSTAAGSRFSVAIHGGFLEIAGAHVRVLADRAEPAKEIDQSRAMESLRRAEKRLVNPAVGIDIARALRAYQRAQARLDAAKAKAGVH
ncbi:MAG: ATP synthase F1 subunit epsilon [Bryobacteraceae bacterium]|nr:ATP synthase F1 subunit epsilon [Bryobacteraceae bacterium]